MPRSEQVNESEGRIGNSPGTQEASIENLAYPPPRVSGHESILGDAAQWRHSLEKWISINMDCSDDCTRRTNVMIMCLHLI